MPTTRTSIDQDLDPPRLREAFGVFPSGVVAVAAEVNGIRTGLAASSFTSVSLQPPLVSFSVARSSKTWPHLRMADRLGLTVLAEFHGAWCRQLAGPVESRFDGVDVSTTERGAVVLQDGLARFDCSIHREVEAGDHVIVVLQVHAVDHTDSRTGALPLVFHRSRFGLTRAARGS
ncbi:flavin reductase [Nocardioides humi]